MSPGQGKGGGTFHPRAIGRKQTRLKSRLPTRPCRLYDVREYTRPWGCGPKVGQQTFNLSVSVRFRAPPFSAAVSGGKCNARPPRPREPDTDPVGHLARLASGPHRLAVKVTALSRP